MNQNNRTKKYLFALGALLLPIAASAQYAWQEGAEAGKLELGKDLHYQVEMQGSFSKGKTPLWLNANKYGLSSLDKNNGYLRGSVIRPLATDSARRWGMGYGVDVAVPVNYTSHVVVQQAFVEARWLHGVLTAGAKQYPMELKNQTLSSGSQTLGINARPVPQVRLALPEYWTIPILHHWLHIKGHIAYGMMTDDNWQHEFTQRKSKYADHILYHSKAGYLKIGNEDAFCPLSLEVGLEMADEFGGKPYRMVGDKMEQVPTQGGLKGMWDAFIPGGADATTACMPMWLVTRSVVGCSASIMMPIRGAWVSMATIISRIIVSSSSSITMDMVRVTSGWSARSAVSIATSSRTSCSVPKST